MILEVRTSYPSARCYVVKLHRRAAPLRAGIIGRLESVATGQQFKFNNADELIACLVQHIAQNTLGEIRP